MSREKNLVREFDKSLDRLMPRLFSSLGEREAVRLSENARREYQALLPRIPSIGRNNPLTVFFHPTPRYLAAYRAFRGYGFAEEDAGYLVFEIGREDLLALPRAAHSFLRHIWFSPFLKNRLIKRARDTQLRRYPMNFVMDYVEGDGGEFDYGIDYVECANCKFLRAEGALELTPYLCAMDKNNSELLGWGLTRTMTLAEGSPKCDFRFKKGGVTFVPFPQPLQERIDARPI
jgi:hypothetical protein